MFNPINNGVIFSIILAFSNIPVSIVLKYGACLSLLQGLSPALYVTAVPGLSRSLEPTGLLKAAEGFSWRNAPCPFDSPLDAVEAATAENEVVLVCGSLYLIGWIRPRLQGLKNE